MIKEKVLNLISLFSIKFKRLEARNNWDLSDVFLVSFPKSGTTWLCLLIARSLQLYKKDNRRLDLMNVHDYVPDYHANPEYIDNVDQPRIIKTHEDFYSHKARIDIKGRKTIYPRYIILLRNGTDSMESYFNYKSALGEKNIDFDSFCKKYKGTRDDWSFHTDSWMNQEVIDKKYFHVLKYEDLLSRTETVLSKLLEFIGLNLDIDQIKDIVEYCDISNMRNYEKLYGDGVNYKNKKYDFVRKEEKRDGIKISANQLRDYKEANKKLFDQLDY